MICRGLDIENDFFVCGEVDKVGEVEGENEGVCDDNVGEMSAETERLERHGKRRCVDELWGGMDGREELGDDGIVMCVGSGTGSCNRGGALSVAEYNVSVGVGGMNEIRGEGDRERRRPEREGSVDKR